MAFFRGGGGGNMGKIREGGLKFSVPIDNLGLCYTCTHPEWHNTSD